MKKKRRLLSLLLAFAMALTLIPATAFPVMEAAAEEEEHEGFSNGTGAFGLPAEEGTPSRGSEDYWSLAQAAPFGAVTSSNVNRPITLNQKSELFLFYGWSQPGDYHNFVRRWDYNGNGLEGQRDTDLKAATGSGYGTTYERQTYLRFADTAALNVGNGKDDKVAMVGYNGDFKLYLRRMSSTGNVEKTQEIGLLADDRENKNSNFSNGNLGWLEAFKGSSLLSVAAGDFDGDGIDSAVVFNPSFRYKIDGKKVYKNSWKVEEYPIATYNWTPTTVREVTGDETGEEYNDAHGAAVDLVAEDIDRDGMDELILVENRLGTKGTPKGVYVYIYEKINNSWQQTWMYRDPDMRWVSVGVGNVATAEMADMQEIVIAGWQGDSDTKWKVHICHADGTWNSSYNRGKFVDGANNVANYATVLDTTVDANAYSEGGYSSGERPGNLLDVATFNAKGGANPEYVFINGSVFEYNSTGSASGEIGDNSGSLSEVKEAKHNYFNSDDGARDTVCILESNNIASTAVGNFDGNDEGREQVYFFTLLGQMDQNDSWVDSYVYGMDANGSWYQREGPCFISEQNSAFATACAIDDDSDSVVARFSGLERKYSVPDVMAVLETFPYFSELSDDLWGESTTVYSSETVKGQSHATSNSLNTNILIGFEAEAPIPPIGGGYEISIDNNFTWGSAQSSSIAYSIDFANNSGQNAVVIHREPYIDFTYEDINHGYQPIHVRKTLDPDFAMISLEDYNEQVSAERQIDPSKLGIPGNPFSYASTWANVVDANGTQTNGQGSGSSPQWVSYGSTVGNVTQEFEYEDTSEKTFTYDFGVTINAWATAFGAKVGGGAGYGHSIENTTIDTSGLTKSGTVQGIGGQGIKGYDFQWRFAHWTMDVNGTKVPVLGYLVQNQVAPPSPGVNLRATDITSSSAKIQWESGDRAAGEYRVYMKAEGEEDFMVGTVSGADAENGTYSFVVDELQPGETYEFVVRGWSSGLEESVDSQSLFVRANADDLERILISKIQDIQTSAGNTVEFNPTVTQVDATSFTCQWEKREKGANAWENISDKKSSRLTLTNVSKEMDGSQYRLRVNARVGVKSYVYYSNIATLNVSKDISGAEKVIVSAEGGSGTESDPYTGQGSYTTETTTTGDIYSVATAVWEHTDDTLHADGPAEHTVYAVTPDGEEVSQTTSPEGVLTVTWPAGTRYFAICESGEEDKVTTYHELEKVTAEDGTESFKEKEGDPLEESEKWYSASVTYGEDGVPEISETEITELPTDFDGDPVTVTSGEDTYTQMAAFVHKTKPDEEGEEGDLVSDPDLLEAADGQFFTYWKKTGDDDTYYYKSVDEAGEFIFSALNKESLDAFLSSEDEEDSVVSVQTSQVYKGSKIASQTPVEDIEGGSDGAETADGKPVLEKGDTIILQDADGFFQATYTETEEGEKAWTIDKNFRGVASYMVLTSEGSEPVRADALNQNYLYAKKEETTIKTPKTQLGKELTLSSVLKMGSGLDKDVPKGNAALFIITDMTTGKVYNINATVEEGGKISASWTAPSAGLYSIVASIVSTATMAGSQSEPVYYRAGGDPEKPEYSLTGTTSEILPKSVTYGESVNLLLKKRNSSEEEWEEETFEEKYIEIVYPGEEEGQKVESLDIATIDHAAGDLIIRVWRDEAAYQEGDSAAGLLTSAVVSVLPAKVTVKIAEELSAPPQNISDIELTAEATEEGSGLDNVIGKFKEEYLDNFIVDCSLYDEEGKLRTDCYGNYAANVRWITGSDDTAAQNRKEIEERYIVTLEGQTLSVAAGTAPVEFSSDAGGSIKGSVTMLTSGMTTNFNSGTPQTFGNKLSFLANPLPGFQVDAWSVNGVSYRIGDDDELRENGITINEVGSGASETRQQLEIISFNQEKHISDGKLTVSVTFTNKSARVTYSVGKGSGDLKAYLSRIEGTQIPSGSNVIAGANVVFVAVPNDDQMVESWSITRGEKTETYHWLGTMDTYRENILTLANIQEDVEVKVNFVAKEETTVYFSMMSKSRGGEWTETFSGGHITVTNEAGKSLSTDKATGSFQATQGYALTFEAVIDNPEQNLVHAWEYSTDGETWTTVKDTANVNTYRYNDPDSETLYVRALIDRAQLYPLHWRIQTEDGEDAPEEAKAVLTAVSSGNVIEEGSHTAHIPVVFTLTTNGDYYVVRWENAEQDQDDPGKATLKELKGNTTVTAVIAEKPTVELPEVEKSQGEVIVKGTYEGEEVTFSQDGNLHFDPGTDIQVEAVPTDDYYVSGINDQKFPAKNGARSYTFEKQTEDLTITAEFTEKPQVTLPKNPTGGTVEVKGTYAGKEVTFPHNGENYHFDPGTDLTITAKPNDDYYVEKIQDETFELENGEKTKTLLNQKNDVEITVVFQEKPQVTLPGDLTGGKVEVKGTYAGKEVTFPHNGTNLHFDRGTDLTITAKPDDDYYVVQIQEESFPASHGDKTKILENQTESVEITAVFHEKPKVKLPEDPIGGTVEVTGTYAGEEMTFPHGEGNLHFDPGTDLTITAKPNDDYCVKSIQEETYTVEHGDKTKVLENQTEDVEIKVVFQEKPKVILPENPTGGTVEVKGTYAGNEVTFPHGEGNLHFDPGTDLTITAKPDSDYYVQRIQEETYPAEYGDREKKVENQTEDLTVEVTFQEKAKLVLPEALTGGTLEVTGTFCGQEKTWTSKDGGGTDLHYDPGTGLTVTLKPDTGYLPQKGNKDLILPLDSDNYTEKVTAEAAADGFDATVFSFRQLGRLTVHYFVISEGGYKGSGKEGAVAHGTLEASASRKQMEAYSANGTTDPDKSDNFDDEACQVDVYEGGEITLTATGAKGLENAADQAHTVDFWSVDKEGNFQEKLQVNDRDFIGHELIESYRALKAVAGENQDVYIGVCFSPAGVRVSFGMAEGQEELGNVTAALDSGEPLENGARVGEDAKINFTGSILDDHYEVKKWKVGNESHPEANGTTFTAITDERNLDVSLELRGKVLENFSVQSEGQGTAVSDPEAGEVRYKESVTLTATPKEGYEFEGWYYDGQKIEEAAETYTITEPENGPYVAKFKAIGGLSVNYAVNPAEGGSIEATADGAAFSSGDASLKSGQTVVLKLNLADGWRQSTTGEAWSNLPDGAEISEDGLTVTLPALLDSIPETITANVEKIPEYTVEIIQPAKSIEISAFIDGERQETVPFIVKEGTEVTFRYTYVEGPSYVFAGWLVNGGSVESGSDGELTVEVREDITVSASTSFGRMYRLKIEEEGEEGADGTVNASIDNHEANYGRGEYNIPKDSTVMFTASPSEDSMIKEWIVNGVSQTTESGRTYLELALPDLIMDQDIAVKAVFEPKVEYPIPASVENFYEIKDVETYPTTGVSEGMVRKGGDISFTIVPAADEPITAFLPLIEKLQDENGATVTWDESIKGWKVEIKDVQRAIEMSRLRIKLELGVSKVPESLTGDQAKDAMAKYLPEGTGEITAEVIEEVMKRAALEAMPLSEGNQVLYDVTLQKQNEEGNWEDVTSMEDFPAGGVTVILPYPEGTNQKDTFTALHMFAVGEKSGQIEQLDVTHTSMGLQFHAASLSPVMLAWTTPPDTVLVAPIRHGSADVSNRKAEAGDTVRITPKAEKGYMVSTVMVTDKNGKVVKLKTNGTTYSFVMPEEDAHPVTVSVTTKCKGSTNCPSRKFTDVDLNAWYHESIDYVIENNLMTGFTNPENTFGPTIVMDRAMFVTVLYRIDGEPEAGTAQFSDVPEDEYYSRAVAWASENGIVTGYKNEENCFGPHDKVTREQVATIFYRYAQYKGYDTSKRSDLREYPDRGQITPYALEAVQWANAEGIMTGKCRSELRHLDPLGGAQRCELACVIKRFCENIKK